MNRRLILLLAGLLWGIGASAQTTQPAGRFLFIIETSKAMKQELPAAIASVKRLLGAGLDRQLQSGDTIGLWTFSSELHAGEFPLQVWTEQNRQQVVSLTAEFLQQQKPSGRARPDHFLPEMLRLVETSAKLTILIYSTGAQPIEGTPFDESINRIFKLHRQELGDKQIPFVTVLVCRQGKIVKCTVNSAVDVDLPVLPGEQVAKVASKPAGHTQLAKAVPLSAQPMISQPLVKTNPPLIVDYSQSNIVRAGASTMGRPNATPADLQPAMTQAVKQVVPLAVAQPILPKSIPDESPLPPDSKDTAQVTNEHVLIAPQAVAEAASPTSGGTELEYPLVTNASVVTSTTTNPASSRRNYLIWLLAGGVLMLLVAVGVIRRVTTSVSRKNEVSLITRSLEQRRK